jgi:hypothetical protein
VSSPAPRRSFVHQTTSRFVALVGVALIVTFLGLAPTISGIAGAQTAAPDLRPRVRLVSQTPWVGPSGMFTMKLGVPNAPPGAAISVRLYDDVSRGGRLHYLDTLRNTQLGSLLHTPYTVDVANLPTDDEGHLTAAYQIDATSQPFVGFQLRQSGVYPLVVTLQAPGGRELDSFHTAIIRLPESANNESVPLAVSVIAPLNAPLSRRTDGTDGLDPAAASGLDSTVASLAAHPSVPLTVAPLPETIAALDRRDRATGSTTISQLRAALANRQVLGSPTVALDTGAWTAAGMGDELLRQLNDGTNSLADLLDTRPDRRSWLVNDTTTPQALTELRELGVDQVVVPENLLSPLDARSFDRTLTRSFEVDVAGQRTRAVMSDGTLRFHVAATDDPVLNANQLLADLAVLSFDQPALKRGAVLTLPDDGQTPKAFLDALLDGLGDQPAADSGVKSIVSPVSLDGLFSFVEPAGQSGGRGPAEGVTRPEPTLVRTWTSQPAASMATYPTQLGLARNSVAGYRSMLTDLPDADQRSGYLDQLIEVSGSASLTPDQRQAYLDAAVGFVNAQAHGIEVPEQQRVTLTSSQGEVPVEVDNNLDYPVHVELTLSSDKIEFLDRASFSATLQPGSNRITIPVRAKSSGLFPVNVTASSPDGVLPMSTGRLPVRSTAVSGLGLILTIAAGLFLALWWARNFRTSRRSRRLVPDPGRLVDHDGTIEVDPLEATTEVDEAVPTAPTPTVGSPASPDSSSPDPGDPSPDEPTDGSVHEPVHEPVDKPAPVPRSTRLGR